jgi:hypothetical protein
VPGRSGHGAREEERGVTGEFAGGFDATANRTTRDRREELGRAAFLALYAILRNARMHAEDNAAFDAPVEQIGRSIAELIATDGAFDLQLAADGLYVNRQAVRLDATTNALLGFVRGEMLGRGIHGLSARTAPDALELRRLVRLFTPSAPRRPGAQGDPAAPLLSLRLSVEVVADSAPHVRTHDTRLIDVYSYAVFFVSRTIAQLRSGAQALPVWAASRLVQDFVDLEELAQLRFLQLSRCKAGAEAYYGYHAANVAVLSIAFGARLGFSRTRRHDLGMAALFHDIGIAAIPVALLNKEHQLTEREMAAMQVTPLFAARAILRDREVHAAALERARAAYDCHCDLAGPRAEPERSIGPLGQIVGICEAFDALTTTRPFRRAFEPAEALHVLRTELHHRFDATLVARFNQFVEPLLS